MKTEEKSTNNERQALIIRKYQQYLKLEKALSANTLDAYLTDLNKLLCFLKTENIDMLAVTLDDLQRFAAGLHDIGIHARSQARIISGIKSFFQDCPISLPFVLTQVYCRNNPVYFFYCQYFRKFKSDLGTFQQFAGIGFYIIGYNQKVEKGFKLPEIGRAHV